MPGGRYPDRLLHPDAGRLHFEEIVTCDFSTERLDDPIGLLFYYINKVKPIIVEKES